MREEKFQCQVFLNGNLNSLGTQRKKQKSQRTNLFSSGALSDEDSAIEKKRIKHISLLSKLSRHERAPITEKTIAIKNV